MWCRYCLILLLMTSLCDSKRGGSSSSRGTSSSRSHRKGSRFTTKSSRVGSIERTAMFRSTIFGVTAGYVAFHAGKIFVHHPEKTMMFEGRSYYWGSEYYMPSDDLPTQCINKIDPLDPQFGRVVFPDESRPSEIVYGCKEADYCCGFDCCQEGTFFVSLFRLLVLILVFSILGIFLIEAFRWGLQCFYTCKHGHPREFVALSI